MQLMHSPIYFARWWLASTLNWSLPALLSGSAFKLISLTSWQQQNNSFQKLGESPAAYTASIVWQQYRGLRNGKPGVNPALGHMNAAGRRKGSSNSTRNKGSITAVGWEECWRGVAPKGTHWKEEEATKESNTLSKTRISKRRSKPLVWTLWWGADFQPVVCISVAISEGSGKVTELPES